MSDHTVSAFDAELKELGRKVVEMGGQAERLVSDSVGALIRRDGVMKPVCDVSNFSANDSCYFSGGVAQLVEHRTHKPAVGSSILPPAKI